MYINNMTILICDDSILIRKKLKESINHSGCNNIIESENGAEAINIYKEKNQILFLWIL